MKEVEKGSEGGGGVKGVNKEQVKGGGGGKKVLSEGVVSVVGGKKVVAEGVQLVKIDAGKRGGKGDKSEEGLKDKEGAPLKVVDKVVSMEDVQVGKVTVRLGKKKPTGKDVCSGKESYGKMGSTRLPYSGQPSIQKLIRKYRS